MFDLCYLMELFARAGRTKVLMEITGVQKSSDLSLRFEPRVIVVKESDEFISHSDESRVQDE